MVLAIDFDGVISEYTTWKGKGNFGTPIAGCAEAIKKLKEAGHTIIIYTTRLEIHQVKEYLESYNILFDYINHNPEDSRRMLHPNKMNADVYIDDKAVTFKGDWVEVADRIIEFKPWWRIDDKAE